MAAVGSRLRDPSRPLCPDARLSMASFGGNSGLRLDARTGRRSAPGRVGRMARAQRSMAKKCASEDTLALPGPGGAGPGGDGPASVGGCFFLLHDCPGLLVDGNVLSGAA